MKKKDYLLVGIVGMLFGLLLLPILNNINLPFFQITFLNAVILVVVFTVFAIIALAIASLISRKIPVILQVAKFAAVGGLNTLLDLGALNLLIVVFSATSGIWYSVFKGVTFIIANINSYFWNKYWTFGSKEGASVKEFGQFLLVSIVGFVINIGTASVIVNIIGPLGGMSPERWANIGALSATILSLVWNFVGYKFIVFKQDQGKVLQTS